MKTKIYLSTTRFIVRGRFLDDNAPYTNRLEKEEIKKLHIEVVAGLKVPMMRVSISGATG